MAKNNTKVKAAPGAALATPTAEEQAEKQKRIAALTETYKAMKPDELVAAILERDATIDEQQEAITELNGQVTALDKKTIDLGGDVLVKHNGTTYKVTVKRILDRDSGEYISAADLKDNKELVAKLVKLESGFLKPVND